MIIILDTETTGLNPEEDELLQVSIISETGETLIDQYVRPTRCTAWPEAERVNHITPEMVRDCPTIHDMAVSMQISRILENADKIIGYNTQFDISFLIAAGYDVPICETVDVMRDFAEVYGDYREELGGYKWQKLTTAAEYYGFEWPIDAHNALGDCLATLYVYQHMQQQHLRPCPFCGQTDYLKTEDVSDGILMPLVYINCSPPLGGCGATGPICRSINHALAAWNRRAADQPHGAPLHKDDVDKILDDALGDDQYQRCDRCGTYRPKNEMFDGLCEECRAEDAAAARAEDAEDQIQRCTRCGTYVDKDTMYAGICAECQAEDEAKSKQAGWYKIEEIIKEVLPDE